MKKQTPDEIEKIQQAILEREVEEELQKERLITFWKKYRIAIMGGLVAILCVTIGTEVYHSWRNKVRLAESDQFEQAVLLSYTGEKDEALQAYQTLADTARTGYKYLAQMRLAQNALEEDDIQTAVFYLKQVMNNSSAPMELRSVARLSLVGHQIGVAPASELEKELQPLLNEQNSFYPSAIELKAILLLEQKKLTEAVQTLNKAIGLPNIPANEKERLKELLSFIQ